MTAFCLDLHARYQCRHAGACCESWTVPAEPEVVALVRTRHLRPNGVTGEILYTFTSADLSQPSSQWQPVATNVLSANGNFSTTATNVVNSNDAQRFYILLAQ